MNSKETDLSQKLIELIDARMAKISVTTGGILFEEQSGVRAIIPITKQSQTITQRVIKGGS